MKIKTNLQMTGRTEFFFVWKMVRERKDMEVICDTKKKNDIILDKPVDLLKSKLIHLGCTLITLLYNGMAAFQYCEATFVGVKYSIIDCL